MPKELLEIFDSKWPMVFSGNGQDQSRKIKDWISTHFIARSVVKEFMDKPMKVPADEYIERVKKAVNDAPFDRGFDYGYERAKTDLLRQLNLEDSK